MTNYAYIKDGIVSNVAYFDSEQTPEFLVNWASAVGADEVVLGESSNCIVGSSYTEGTFTLPVEAQATFVGLPVSESGEGALPETNA
jgi:hypothetical protein